MVHILLQLLFALALVPTQEPDLVVLKQPMNLQTLPPIVIEKIATGEQVITPGKKFYAPDDWLKDLKVTVRNQSDRTLLYVSVAMHFPEQISNGQAPLLLSFSRGKDYLESRTPEHGEDLALRPGETTELSLEENRYEVIMRFYKGSPRSAFSGIMITPEWAILDLDHGWYKDHYMKRDSVTPSTWNVENGKKVY